MKERFKMIFDRIDIFVVCIVFLCCLTVAVAYIGFWKEFAQCFVMTFLITEVCYTTRCNEKLKKELIDTNDKLKEAEKESETAIHQIVKKSRIIRFYVLLEMLWRERWTCEHAKVNYCKHRITLRQLIDAMNHSDKMCDEISNKISELTKELN
ncbi:MAG: hypothetical protein SPD44_00245 [Prevotella sp.]|nr:hypothetical protein [Prevotella sp.]